MMEEREGQKRVTLGATRSSTCTTSWRSCAARRSPRTSLRTPRAVPAPRTTRHPGYAVSQRKRKRVEEVFGWLKTVALMRKVRHRGRQLVRWMFTLAAAAYNLVRIRNLVGAEG